ncbi:GAF domain-containing SpoIIE family protein phosphatase [Nonomuraea jiangxiensis]|uniref:PAS domain S-box-containing protein n=1 Tax=Nonomuraea jiangxiensis TaxID=633440 RepID=A0A1G8X1F7_9ACTN|nr:GAF domain-containing SpoIIE family protein phosphatase [Nonomuraea jiangxiensis]SDJ84167.1 PAS domain S-box-containing protein [Nonomuraea jiangxiensis]
MPDLEHALDALAGRVSSLREARMAYPADLAPTLDAALAELDTAAELLAAAGEALRKAPKRPGSKKDGTQRELKLLRQVFRAFPVPVVVLDGGGVVRRINPETSRMLGSPDGYLVGRSFPLLVDVSRRAAFRSHLTSVLQTGQPAAFETRLAHQGRTHTAQVALTRLTMPGEPQQMVAAVVLPTEVQLPEPGARRPEASDSALLLTAAKRQDLLVRMATLLLDEETLLRPVALARATRLLGAEWADWVIADMVRAGLPHRSVVVGPKNQPMGELVRQVESSDPVASQVVLQVLERGSGVVYEMVDDETLLGFCAEGPLLTAMGAGSMLCVPIGSGDGVLTLVRTHERPPFALADLAVMQEVGLQVGLAVRAQTTFQRRSRAADALSASVAPRKLPDVPGYEAAAVYHPGSSVGAEFYDVFPVSGGWGFALGGAAGKGEEAASVSAMVRGGLRVLSAWESDPAAVMRKVNEALVAQGTGMFVMAVAGFVRGREIKLSSAGHHPAVLLQPDGVVRYAAGGGVPLGISPDAETGVETLTVHPGETLVLYSEGLISSRNDIGEPYGEERLADVLGRCAGQSPSTVVKAVEADRHAFSGGQVWDEIVVLALRGV